MGIIVVKNLTLPLPPELRRVVETLLASGKLALPGNPVAAIELTVVPISLEELRDLIGQPRYRFSAN